MSGRVNERATVFDTVQIGFETTPGTAVPALRRLRSFSIASAADLQTTSIRPEGSKVAGIVVPNREWNGLSIPSGVPTYTELGIALCMALGRPTTTTPGGATDARDHLWTLKPGAPQDPVSATVEQGSSVWAQRSVNAILTALTLTLGRNEVGLGGDGIGEAIQEGTDVVLSGNEVQQVAITGGPTGGTFTLTFDGQTTAGIAYNATASQVQTALEALSNIAVGDVRVTGGPLPATAVQVEFRGAYRQTNVSTLTSDEAALTGGTSPAVNVTTTTAGSAPTYMDLIPILPKQLDLFLDLAYGSIGTTKMQRAFATEFSIGNLYGPVWPMDSSLDSYANIVDMVPDTSLAITLAANEQGSLFQYARQGTTLYVQIAASAAANAIETGFTYEFELNYAGVISAIGGDEDHEGVKVRQWTLTPIEDPALAGFSIRLRNDVADYLA